MWLVFRACDARRTTVRSNNTQINYEPNKQHANQRHRFFMKRCAIQVKQQQWTKKCSTKKAVVSQSAMHRIYGSIDIG